MEIEAFGQTDVGCVRDHNEDTLHIEPALGLYLVCDGMGGHAGGEVASAQAVQAVVSYVREHQALLSAADGSEGSIQAVAEMLYGAVGHASKTVFDIASSDQGKHGMGTTLVALLAVGNKGVMANVGDSRLYMARDGKIAQLSSDHTYVHEALAAGLMSKEEAEASEHAHVLTRAVGTQASVCPDVMVFDLLPGDTFLLCSDGLHDYTRDNSMLCELLSQTDVSGAPGRLVQLARCGGGHDNITAIVVRVAADAGQTAELRRATIVREMDALRDLDLFRELTTPELVRIYGRFVRSEVEAGTVLITEGDTTEHLYVLVQGQVDVEREGRRIARLDRGSHVGEMALLSARPRSATVTAASRCTVLCLDRAQFEELRKLEPAVANKFLLQFARALSLRLDDAYLARDFRQGRTTIGLGKFPTVPEGESDSPS